MRRYLILFLLVLMPLQLSWAAVGSYCEHETGVQADHVGHHAHEHTSSDSAFNLDAGDPDKQGGTQHLDCSVCHAAGLAIPVDLAVSPEVAAGAAKITTHHERLSSAPSSPPERPKWASLA